MKKISILAVIILSVFTAFAEVKPLRDLSGKYYYWRNAGSPTDKAFKTGQTVTVSQQTYQLSLVFGVSKMSPAATSTFTFNNTSDCIMAEKNLGTFLADNGMMSYSVGRQIIEVDKGVFVLCDVNMPFGAQGECNGASIDFIGGAFCEDKAKTETLDAQIIRAKVNEILVEICKQAKSDKWTPKDIRGLSNVASTASAGSTKNIAGTYYVLHNPASHNTSEVMFKDGKEIPVEEANGIVTITGKLLGVKQVGTFTVTPEYMKIEKVAGYKMAKANSDAETKLGLRGSLIEIEPGVICVTGVTIDIRFESKCDTKEEYDNFLQLVLFKDKATYEKAKIGEIKTKMKAALDAQCAKYRATLPPPIGKAAKLPAELNTNAAMKQLAWTAIKNYGAKMGWKDELVGAYVAGADWKKRTKKVSEGGKYYDRVYCREVEIICIYKTPEGLYKSEGFWMREDSEVGDKTGTLFSSTAYVGGFVAAIGFDTQIVSKEDAEAKRLK